MKTNEELFLAGDTETLYTRNMPFMFYIARKFSNLPMEEEDLIGCGNVAFAKCLRLFDPDKSKWITFFNQVMVNEILMANRKINKQVKVVSIESIINNDYERKELTLKEVLASEIGTIDEAMDELTTEEIMKLIKALPIRERKVLMLYLLGTRQEDIAREIETSQSSVSRLIRKIINDLRKCYQKGA